MPIQTPFNDNVYSKTEIDSLLNIKADKVEDAINNNIAGLTGDEGNLLDTGYSLDNLMIHNVLDCGTY